MELLGLPSEHTACKVHGELDWESLVFPTSISQCAQTKSNQVYSCDTSASENDPFQRLQEAGQQGASSNPSALSICCSGVDFLFNMKQAKRDCDVTHCPCDSLFTDSLSPLQLQLQEPWRRVFMGPGRVEDLLALLPRPWCWRSEEPTPAESFSCRGSDTRAGPT